MVSSQKILTAVRSNWWLNTLGLALSFCATVVLIRALPPELYAQYAAVLAMVFLCTLIFDAGGNSGLTRYLAEAGQCGARGSFYLALQRRRWLLSLAVGGLLIVLGPWYAGAANFGSLTEEPWLFVAIALIVVASLTRGLAHYGMVALFETRRAILWEQFFLVSRAGLLGAVALLGGSLWDLVAALLALHVLEAAWADWRLRRVIGAERAPLPPGFVNRAQGFGLLTLFDKACASLGSGLVLLLLLAPFHSALELALFALAVELTGKLISVTVMPMANLVSPYLSQVTDDAAAQGRAVASIIKLSSLLYCFSIGAGLLLARDFVPLVYGETYAAAGAFTLLLLGPVAFENWVRGVSSPALLRNGRYRTLAALNVLQAIVTLGTVWLVHDQPLLTAVTAVVCARAAAAALSLVPLASIAARGAWRVPAQATLLAACAVVPWFLLEPLPLPPVARLLVQGAVFALTYYLGVRWLILRDGDLLQLAHRLAGRGPVARLLPPMPC